jgi:glycosyltransferase involved in cell wall biosynthesis
MLLSVITPVLNGERFIRKNIESIAQLTIPYEHIIVDGGSTDGTLEVLMEYSNLVVVQQAERNGMYGAIKQGFEMAKGNIITWVNCDDSIVAKEYAKMAIKLSETGADLIYSDSYIHYEKENRKEISRASVLGKYFIRKGTLPFIQPASMYTKAFYESIGGLNTKYKITGDMDLFYRMANNKMARFIKHKGASVVFLKYGESLGDRNTEKGHREREDAGIPYPSLLTKVLFGIFRRIV